MNRTDSQREKRESEEKRRARERKGRKEDIDIDRQGTAAEATSNATTPSQFENIERRAGVSSLDRSVDMWKMISITQVHSSAAGLSSFCPQSPDAFRC